jgi:hypothetical protein
MINSGAVIIYLRFTAVTSSDHNVRTCPPGAGKMLASTRYMWSCEEAIFHSEIMTSRAGLYNEFPVPVTARVSTGINPE